MRNKRPIRYIVFWVSGIVREIETLQGQRRRIQTLDGNILSDIGKLTDPRRTTGLHTDAVVAVDVNEVMRSREFPNSFNFFHG